MSTPVELSAQQVDEIIATVGLDNIKVADPAKLSPEVRMAIGVVILRRKTHGETQAKIAADLGISPATCSRYYRTALESVQLPGVTEAKKEMIEQIDSLLDVWIPMAESGDEKAAAVVLKFMERRAKLLGTDAPIEVSQTVVEVSQQERELQALLAQEERDNAMRESAERTTA